MLESLFKIKFRSRHSYMLFKFLISQESVCVGVFLNKVAGPITATLLNRDSNTRDFLWNLQIFFLEHFCCCFWNVSGFQAATIIKKTNENSTSNWRRFDVKIMSIRRRASFDEFTRHFHVLFRCSFADQKITSFPSTFFDEILMVKKSTLTPRTFFDVISVAEKSTLFPLTFLM